MGDRKDLEKTAEWVNSQEYKQQKQKSVQDEISTKFASTSLKDLQATAQTQGYDINGRQKENLHSHSHQSNNRGPQHGHASSSPSSPSSQSSASSRFASTSIQDLQDIACDEGYDINGLDRKDLEKTAEWVNSQEYNQQKQKSVQDEISTKFASTSLKDLQATAQTQGYDINGLDRRELQKIATRVYSPEFIQENQISAQFESSYLNHLQATAQTEGYDINGLDRRDLEKIAEWVNSQEYKKQKQNPEVHAEVSTTQTVTKMAQDGGYGTTSFGFGLGCDNLEKIAEWVYPQQKKQDKAHSEVKASTASRFQKEEEKAHSRVKASTSSRFSSTPIGELRTIAYNKGYDINGLEREDLEQIAEWVHP